MSLLTKGQINQHAGKRRYQIVPVPEWDGDVRVQSLTVAEHGTAQAYLDEEGKDRNDGHFRAMLCALSIVDDSGVRLYDDLDTDDFMEMDLAPIARIAGVVFTLSGMGKPSKEALEKNSGGGPTAASS